ncbi:MAG: TasA family protein [Christensenellales bacterium]
MSKKIIAVAAAVIILASIGIVGGTMAWFTDEATAENVFTTGRVTANLTVTPGNGAEASQSKPGGVSFNALMPGDTLFEKVTFALDQSSADAFVRMKFTVTVNEGGDKVVDRKGAKVSDVIAGHVAAAIPKDWQKGSDGWCYLNRSMSNSSSVDFIPGVLKFDGDKFDNNFQGIKFSIEFEAHAIQTANQNISHPYTAEKLAKLAWPAN